MHRLTIAVPTFDRNEILLRTLPRVLAQMTPECELLVLDNHSKVPVARTLGPLLGSRPSVRILRTPHNLGAAANILRCFEHCRSPWMWLLGDDDLVAEDAVARILAEIAQAPDTLYFNFASRDHPRTKGFTTRGLNGLAEGLDSWSHLLFMSVGVYQVPRLLAGLAVGYHYCYSRAPHVALVMQALQDSGQCRFSEATIIDRRTLAETTWEALPAMLGKFTLLELIGSPAHRRLMARKLALTPSLEATALRCHFAALDPGYAGSALYLFDQLIARGHRDGAGLLVRGKILLYRLLVKYPRLTGPPLHQALPTLLRWAGRAHLGLEDIRPKDRHGRF